MPKAYVDTEGVVHAVGKFVDDQRNVVAELRCLSPVTKKPWLVHKAWVIEGPSVTCLKCLAGEVDDWKKDVRR